MATTGAREHNIIRYYPEYNASDIKRRKSSAKVIKFKVNPLRRLGNADFNKRLEVGCVAVSVFL